MKIGIRAGHTLRSTGSSGLIDETTEVRKIKAEVIRLLSNYTEIVDLQPPETMAYPDELNYGINLANSSNLDLGFSIHFNNAYTSYDGAIGTEVHVATNSSIKDNIAQRVVDNLAAFGFKNRGIYESPRLGEIRCTNCCWMIIEVCFVEASRDVEIYKSVGVETIAKAIVEGILGYKIDGNSSQSQQPANQMPTKPMYIVTRYLPQSYQGYDGIEIDKIIHTYFENIKCYVRSDSTKKIWIETEYVQDLNKLDRVVNNLNNAGLYYSVNE